MNCTKCGGETTVKDSRMRQGNIVKRRRFCLKCGYRFTTYESRSVLPDNIKIASIKNAIDMLSGLVRRLESQEDECPTIPKL